MKVIAFYLPQFYAFPENDKWWGKGFTEWTNVKKSKPLFKGHYQPTVPLNNNYYCLDDVNVMRWQAKLAKEYGVDGFCFYHYWFGEGRQLMEKPVERYLQDKSIEFPFCFCWANHNWSRTWVGGDKDILMDVRYGNEEEWRKHFEYLFPFFKDSRYLKINNKPIFVIYNPQLIPELKKMTMCFRKWALNAGFEGLTIISQLCLSPSKEIDECIDYYIEYEPNYALQGFFVNPTSFLVSYKFTFDMLSHAFKALLNRIIGMPRRPITRSYNALWNYILNHRPENNKMIAGAFVRCDVSPRRQERALIFTGDAPRLFEKYMKKLFEIVKNYYSIDMVFITAWNEWGEGMYLEPDEKNKFGYLEALKRSKSDVF